MVLYRLNFICINYVVINLLALTLISIWASETYDTSVDCTSLLTLLILVTPNQPSGLAYQPTISANHCKILCTLFGWFYYWHWCHQKANIYHHQVHCSTRGFSQCLSSLNYYIVIYHHQSFSPSLTIAWSLFHHFTITKSIVEPAMNIYHGYIGETNQNTNKMIVWWTINDCQQTIKQYQPLWDGYITHFIKPCQLLWTLTIIKSIV